MSAARLISENPLSNGHSGVRPEMEETLLEMLNRGATPVFPSQGMKYFIKQVFRGEHLRLIESLN